MGMFDYVECEVPLPDGKPATQFQTKDFDAPYMETYTITAAGRLIYHKRRYEHVPEEQRPYWGKPEWFGPDGKPGIMSICGAMRSSPDGDVDMNFHGVLNFYSWSKDDDRREFYAKFTDGNLVAITQDTEPSEQSEPRSEAERT